MPSIVTINREQFIKIDLSDGELELFQYSDDTLTYLINQLN